MEQFESQTGRNVLTCDKDSSQIAAARPAVTLGDRPAAIGAPLAPRTCKKARARQTREFHRQQVVTGGNARAALVDHLLGKRPGEHTQPLRAQFGGRLEAPVRTQIVAKETVDRTGDVPAALLRARQRLAALAADPARNARQVAKVLLKFYLLDARSLPFDRLVQHLAGARYFTVINERYFRVPFDQLIERSVHELVAVGAAECHDGVVANRDG